jgi:DNA modification methylase
MSVHILIGDCRRRLQELPDGSVHSCVTSAPYFGLRDYGVSGQIGLEETPDDFICAVVDVFREVRRVLRGDGSIWVNIADSYAESGNGGGGSLATKRAAARAAMGATRRRYAPAGYKQKDLILIAANMADALREDGWYLRKTIIWAKPSASEPPRLDRPSVGHEYVYLLTKEKHSAVRNPGEDWWNNDVWVIPPSAGTGHIAPMPEELAARCIKASTPTGGVVLDPFGGAGTTGLVADRLRRNAIICELNPEYAALAERRIVSDAALLSDVLVA